MLETSPERIYAAIDLKSFYASVECVERGLNPLTARLVVADESRTDKTICLAVSPALKAYGIPGRARLFEVKERLEEVRRRTGKTVDFIAAPPRMARYMTYSRRIVDIYRKYVSDEDLHIYSVDEVFIDLTPYLGTCYRMSAHELTIRIIRDILQQTGITATAGIGTNLYLAKVAMDIVAKHLPADTDGVRIAQLDERSYREQLWGHRPIRDFWRVGKGIATKLEESGIDTMGKLARLSVLHGDWLYHQFGIAAELLIDHAWGYEPTTIRDIHAYRPATHSLSCGQVLGTPYPCDQARTVALEMADNLALELVAKRLVTKQLVIDISYDKSSQQSSAHGSANLSGYTSSAEEILRETRMLFTRIADPALPIRRLNITFAQVVPEQQAATSMAEPRQLSLFEDENREQQKQQEQQRQKERKLQQAVVDIKRKYGKNAVLKGLNFNEGATGRERNRQIGGHRA